MEKQRYEICSDGDYDYYVPIEQVEQFYAWVASFEDESEDEYTGLDFDSNRIDGTFTFTDPQCR